MKIRKRRRYVSPQHSFTSIAKVSPLTYEQEHKKKVKEEKREARKAKMPKHVKKKLISGKKK